MDASIYPLCSVSSASIKRIDPSYCQLIYEDAPLGKFLLQLLMSHWFFQPLVNIKDPLAYISKQTADLKLHSSGRKRRAVEVTSALVSTHYLILDALSQPVVHMAFSCFCFFGFLKILCFRSCLSFFIRFLFVFFLLLFSFPSDGGF